MIKNVLRFLSVSLATLVVSTMISSVIPASAAEVEDPLIVVSLGDSYSSGEGIEPFYYQWLPIEEKANNYDWLAHRSEKSWPSQLEIPDSNGNFLTMGEYRDEWNKPECKWYFRASSGAETIHFGAEGIEKSEQQKKPVNFIGGTIGNPIYYKDEKEMPFQLSVFDEIHERETVDYVTLSVGGNDVHFSTIVEFCVKNSTYLHHANGVRNIFENIFDNSNTFGDKPLDFIADHICGNVADEIQKIKDDFYEENGTADNIKKVYKAIENKAGTQATIIVAGYPKLFDKKGRGAYISKEEADAVNEGVAWFNTQIRDIIEKYQEEGMNIYFVDVEKEFDEHGAYSDVAWINPIWLKKRSQDLEFGIGSDYSVHPNEEGAKAYARCVNAKIRELAERNQKGTLSGKIVKASDRITPVENANISISNKNIIYSTVADSTGNYTFNLPAGDYQIKIDAPGYVDFKAYVTVIPKETMYMETFLLVEGSETETGIASGKIYDGLTGSGINDVTLTIRDGWNNPGTDDSNIIATTNTDSTGAYSVSLPYGNYTVSATKNGYISTTFNIISQEGTTDEQNGTMSSGVSNDGFRIILTWGENPNDLDSHVEGKLSDGSSFHTYFEDMFHYDGDIEVCNLDVDDTTSYGPETVTLNPTTTDAYYYYIYKYNGSGTVSTSGAQIKVYQDNNLIKTFNVPTNLGDSDYWNVFAIKNGEIIVRNTITENAETDYAE